jgi:hypothetical protein
MPSQPLSLPPRLAPLFLLPRTDRFAILGLPPLGIYISERPSMSLARAVLSSPMSRTSAFFNTHYWLPYHYPNLRCIV